MDTAGTNDTLPPSDTHAFTERLVPKLSANALKISRERRPN